MSAGLPNPPRGTSWQNHAACKTIHPDVFFSNHGQDSDEAAKIVCRGCEVRAECLAYAKNLRIEYGVWGGLTARERGVRAQKNGVELECWECGFLFVWEKTAGSTQPRYCSDKCRNGSRRRQKNAYNERTRNGPMLGVE